MGTPSLTSLPPVSCSLPPTLTSLPPVSCSLPPTLTSLPPDLKYFEIIKYLTLPSFFALGSTNRSFSQLRSRSVLWNIFLRRDFPEYPYSGDYPMLIYRLIYCYLRTSVERFRFFRRNEVRNLLHLDENTLYLISCFLPSKIISVKIQPWVTGLTFLLRPQTKLIINEFILNHSIINLEINELDNHIGTKLKIKICGSISRESIDLYRDLISDYLKIPLDNLNYKIIINTVDQLINPLIDSMNLKKSIIDLIDVPDASDLFKISKIPIIYRWTNGPHYINIIM